MSNIESLHTHTTLSDGKLSHREMFDLAESLGLSVIAFTDHDALPSPKVMEELEILRYKKTKWIIGTELSAGLPRELAQEKATVHIIGLFVDPTNENLIKHCKLAQRSRITRMQKIVTALQEFGFKITENDCLEASGGESVGRPHIVDALKKYPENNIIIEKTRRELAREAENDQVLLKYYNYMMQKGERSYPYMLFLTPDAFRPAYFDHDYMPDLDEAVSLIRGAGGLAFVAHYFTVRSKMSLDFFDKLLAEKRIDGAEIVYGLREYGTAGEQAILAETASLCAIIVKNNAVAAGGSDAHTKEDLEAYVREVWFSNGATGFAAKMISSGRVNKKFSSIE